MSIVQDLSAIPSLRPLRNLVPLPYRRISVQPYDGAMTVDGIREHFLGREAYRRTDFVALRHQHDETKWAVISITRANDEPLFSEIVEVEVLALPEQCAFLESPETDCANPSALAALARENGLGDDTTVVVQGLYDHVNFIHHPDPLVLKVVEVAPPEPPKLYDLLRHVLSYATDLPPIVLDLERIELRALCETVQPAAYLVPCRSGGLDDLSAPVHFLDERPATRQDWTLVGCERSLQFHRHFYGDEPPRIEMCPRVIAGQRDEPTMLKCCLLEFHTERDGQVAVVPWGADLAMVESALRDLVGQQIEVHHD
ncbi:MAG: hypothetical protein OER77_01700 [Myxococcales bacterium]|nr:hypothetical protein [Myxococcales bacterium]